MEGKCNKGKISQKKNKPKLLSGPTYKLALNFKDS